MMSYKHMAIENETVQKNGNTSRLSSTTPQIITLKELNYYREQCKVPCNQEIQSIIFKEEKKRDLINENMKRKLAINNLGSNKIKEQNQRLKKVDLEAQKLTMNLLERAENMQIEQEDEIQKCSRFILETKCRAVRDAQIAEKNIIDKELKEESQFMNDMMENERRLAIKRESEKNKIENKKKQDYAKALKKQILENEKEHQIEIQRKQEENLLNSKIEIQNNKENILKLKVHDIENAKIQKSLFEINSQLKHFKNIEKEENRIMDARIQEYHRMKQQRDRETVFKQKLIIFERENAQEKLALAIQSACKTKDQREEVNDLRIQDEVEKKWRLKEKEEASKTAKNELMLKLAREKQIKEKQIMTALEIKRDKEQLDKIAAILNQSIQNDLQERSKKLEETTYHRNEILKQINEKENQRRLMKKQMFEEGLNIRREAEMRKGKLRAAIDKKYDEMKKNNVPEKYFRKMMSTMYTCM